MADKGVPEWIANALMWAVKLTVTTVFKS